MVNHTHIIKYFHCYREGPLFCVAMEYSDKGNLTTWLQEQAKLPDCVCYKEYTVWRCISHLSSALDY